jgi:hypothetical protein
MDRLARPIDLRLRTKNETVPSPNKIEFKRKWNYLGI